MEGHESAACPVRQISTSEYYAIAGYTKTTQRVLKAKQENGISKLESSFGTPNTANLATLSTFLTKLLPNVKKLIQFYGNEHAGLRFLNYRGRQKADEYLASILIDGDIAYHNATTN